MHPNDTLCYFAHVAAAFWWNGFENFFFFNHIVFLQSLGKKHTLQPSNTHTFLMEKFLWVGVIYLTFLCSMHAQAVIWVAEVPFSQPSGVRNNSGCMCKEKKVHRVHFFSLWAASRIMKYIDHVSHGTHNFGAPTCQRLMCLLSATAKNTNCFAPFALSGLIWHYAYCPANYTQSLGKYKLYIFF